MSLSVSRCITALATAGLCALLSAQAATPAKGKQPPSKVRFIDAPSSENPAARNKRLKKECKGRPNAGMCLGHTR